MHNKLNIQIHLDEDSSHSKELIDKACNLAKERLDSLQPNVPVIEGIDGGNIFITLDQ